MPNHAIPASTISTLGLCALPGSGMLNLQQEQLTISSTNSALQHQLAHFTAEGYHYSKTFQSITLRVGMVEISEVHKLLSFVTYTNITPISILGGNSRVSPRTGRSLPTVIRSINIFMRRCWIETYMTETTSESNISWAAYHNSIWYKKGIVAV